MVKAVWEVEGVKRGVRCVTNVLRVADLDEYLVTPSV